MKNVTKNKRGYNEYMNLIYYIEIQKGRNVKKGDRRSQHNIYVHHVNHFKLVKFLLHNVHLSVF